MRLPWDCHQRFDDLTDTIFAGHHQPLKVWILCLYFMGLNLSNEQIASELGVNRSDAQQMTAHLREGIVKKSLR
jgi:transposase-like protein